MPFENERPIVLEKFMEDLLAARNVPTCITRWLLYLVTFYFQDLDEDEDDEDEDD